MESFQGVSDIFYVEEYSYFDTLSLHTERKYFGSVKTEMYNSQYSDADCFWWGNILAFQGYVL